MLGPMDVVRLGLSIRALRRRRMWTQRQLAERIGLSASEISKVERGAAGQVQLRVIERMLEALGARLSIRAFWQGEELDRLLDRDHAQMIEAMLDLLGSDGWVTIPEATFQIGTERGSIDILAFHPATAILLVIEVKSVVPDIQATLAGIDRKARIAPAVARQRGWNVSSVGRLLVLPNDRTARRRVDAFSSTFDRALPARTVAVRRWLAAPSGPLAGVLFLSDFPRGQARHRVRSAGGAVTLARRRAG